MVVDDNNFNIYSLQCLLEVNFNMKADYVSLLIHNYTSYRVTMDSTV